MGPGSRGRDQECKCRCARVDDRAGVYELAPWLLEDLLDVSYGDGVVDHHTGGAARVGVVPNLGGRALSGEQFDADLIEAVRLAGSVQQKSQPVVKPDLTGGAQEIVAVRRHCRLQFELVERDAPEIV